MKKYIEERAVEVATYIIENNATVRQAAKQFGISKSTVHKDCAERCTYRKIIESKGKKASNVNCSLFSPFSCYSIVKYSLNINVFEQYIRLFMVAGESALLFK